MLLHHFSLTLKQGESFLVRAPNGAGKTSLLRALYGLLPLAQGNVTPLHAPHCLFLGHQDGLSSSLTVEDNLMFRARLWNIPHAQTHIHHILETHELAPLRHRPIERLSAGQRQKIAIASLALPPNTKIWLMDEPDHHLDETQTQWLTRLIGHHTKRGGGAIIATHRALDVPSSSTIQL